MGKVLYQGKSEGDVYPIYFHKATEISFSPKICNSVHAIPKSSLSLWHIRLGHPNDQVLNTLFPKSHCLDSNKSTSIHSCTHCFHGKMHRLPFPKS